MVNFYPIRLSQSMNIKNTCQSKREKKKNYSPLVAIAFSTNGASYKKKHKTIFNKKKYVYNVMLHVFLLFFFLEKK